ncbi:hypothetical protein SAMN05660710_00727 [Paracoccus tibetensis]|uniref:Uncharacterized protein n=2 Tax=Paracoccus tibetensis TaxID=336292 RepID=A0A1G5DA98_9RHOB|nr:hypothetical protein SAMN05660710_00727 [Paracoccus tibetensis]
MSRLFVTVMVSAGLLAPAGLAQTAGIPAQGTDTAPLAEGAPAAAPATGRAASGKINLRNCPKHNMSNCRGVVMHRRGR